MSKAYQFPHDEPNPFTEPVEAEAVAGEEANPYAAGAAPATAGASSAAYHRTLAPRGPKLFALSVAGLAGSVFALALAYFGLPLGLLSLLASAPAWSMARHDLLAMQQGAMSSAQQQQVRTALRLARLGTFLSIAALLAATAVILWLLIGG